VIIQLIVFIATIIYTQTEGQTGFNPYMLLGNAPKTLQTFGMRMPWRIRESYQIQRLLFSLYVNHGFQQVITNCII